MGDAASSALALLERLRAAAAAQSRIGTIIEIRALQTLALAAVGKQDAAAAETAAEALTLGCQQGYVRVFADEGASMQALLTRLVAGQRDRQAAPRAADLGCLAGLPSAVAVNVCPFCGMPLGLDM